MSWKIPLSDVTMGEEEKEAVRAVLESGWLSMGPVTERFEKAFAAYLGVKHAFAVANGTAALHIAQTVAGVKDGDEVITPSLTFVATANSIVYCRGSPVFAEIGGMDDFNVSPEGIEAVITPRTRAITVVHYGGHPCDMKPILETAEKHGLMVIEDAAHAIGARYQGKMCGAIGDLGCFSFFANKNLPTGEGGMVVTDDDTYAERIRILRSHGMTTLTWDRHRGHGHSYDVVDTGYNYRINEIASAIGIIQLEKLDNHNQKRAGIVDRYRRRLEEVEPVSCPFSQSHGTPSHHIFPLLLSPELSRSDLFTALKERGIQTSIHYPPIHLFTHYQRTFGCKRGTLPLTEYAGDHEMTLPLYPAMTARDVDDIVESISAAIRKGKGSAPQVNAVAQ